MAVFFASAHLLALHYLENGGKSDFFNLGNEKGTSVLEVIDAAKRVTGKDFQVVLADRRAGDPESLSEAVKKPVKYWDGSLNMMISKLLFMHGSGICMLNTKKLPARNNFVLS